MLAAKHRAELPATLRTALGPLLVIVVGFAPSLAGALDARVARGTAAPLYHPFI